MSPFPTNTIVSFFGDGHSDNYKGGRSHSDGLATDATKAAAMAVASAAYSCSDCHSDGRSISRSYSHSNVRSDSRSDNHKDCRTMKPATGGGQ